jgi:hypothetical protein
MRQLIADGAAGSAAFRALIDTIDRSDLVVYVECRLFPQRELRGRLGLVSATRNGRFAVIEIACYQAHGSQVAILAHELQHAAEIASAPWVVDAKTFERFYAAAGELVNSDTWSRAYETSAAVESARQVLRELREGDKLRAAARGAAARATGVAADRHRGIQVTAGAAYPAILRHSRTGSSPSSFHFRNPSPTFRIVSPPRTTWRTMV